MNRPTPKPVPIVLDRPPSPRPGRKRRSRRSRWLRSIRSGVRTRRGKWVLITLVCVLVVLIGLLASGFLSAPAPKDDVPAAAGSGAPTGIGTATSPLPSPTPSKSASATKSGGPVSSDQAVLGTLRNQFPDNPLNHLTGAGIHQVVVEARSASGFPLVGWLVPTGLGDTYGTLRNTNGHWTLSERAVGKGYLAAVFIQAGRAGVPVTCKVTVDGKVTNTETTSGSYGRTVCLG